MGWVIVICGLDVFRNWYEGERDKYRWIFVALIPVEGMEEVTVI